jgi:hypothetical protein
MKVRTLFASLAIAFAGLISSGCTYNHYSGHGGGDWHGGYSHHYYDHGYYGHGCRR